MPTRLKGRPYLIAYHIPTGSHPILVELDAADDQEAMQELNNGIYPMERLMTGGPRGKAKLYKLLIDGED